MLCLLVNFTLMIIWKMQVYILGGDGTQKGASVIFEVKLHSK